ncbi:MAG TPA: hypothetical protein VLC53_01510, partial [Myxococcota bacterium]|nr:hypothetical protein [Myxococcota bacterium]
MKKKALALALAAALLITASGLSTAVDEKPVYDPVLQPGAFCAPGTTGKPALLENLVLARTETAPFRPVAAQPALAEAPVLYRDLGRLGFAVTSRRPEAQEWFDQGLRLAFGFNHGEAQRAFREAQRLDPECAMCYWGEA